MYILLVLHGTFQNCCVVHDMIQLIFVYTFQGDNLQMTSDY